jgi:hypothetical protein
MKRFYVSVTKDSGGDKFPTKYGYEFSGATAACEAYGLACRAAGMEPGPQSRLRQWCRTALRGEQRGICDNLRMTAVHIWRAK